jgi:rhamnosyltransferase
MAKEVLVLLAAHNGMRWITQQMQSIRAQESCHVAILASDDASNDGTHEYLASIPGVTLLPQRGPYGSAGRNFFHLLSHADFSGHDFVAFADQDDIWHPWKLARAIECLRRHGCEGYSANVTAFWENGREAVVRKSHPQRELDFLFEGPGPGCTFVMSTRLAKQIQDVVRSHPTVANEISLHDWFAYAWARSHGFAWFIDEQPVARYRQHGRNHLGANVGLRAARSRIEQIRSGWYRCQVESIARACGADSRAVVKKALLRTWPGRLSLAMHAGKFRRRYRDALFLGFISLIGWF